MKALPLILAAGIFCFSINDALAQVKSSNGDKRQTVSPDRICIGIASKGTWGFDLGSCPPNHVYYGNDDPIANYSDGTGRSISLIGSCCPLPFDDILTNKHRYGVLDEYPENSVVTGRGEFACGDFCPMRCTEIDTTKYRLGPKKPGLKWVGEKVILNGVLRGADLSFSKIPAAIRYSFGRINQFAWDQDGCVGDPVGSLLTAKTKTVCEGFTYRELQYQCRY